MEEQPRNGTDTFSSLCKQQQGGYVEREKSHGNSRGDLVSSNWKPLSPHRNGSQLSCCLKASKFNKGFSFLVLMPYIPFYFLGLKLWNIGFIEQVWKLLSPFYVVKQFEECWDYIFHKSLVEFSNEAIWSQASVVRRLLNITSESLLETHFEANYDVFNHILMIVMASNQFDSED
ncbi:hypothetical protein STEG23_020815 [Scotinomys teguina]